MEIVAELCSNINAHDFDFSTFCEAAHESGATMAKIQLWKASHFSIEEHEQKKPLEFPRDRIKEFADIARAHGLVPGASVFDKKAVKLAAEYLGFLKLACREQFSYGLLHFANVIGLPVYRSIDIRPYQRHGMKHESPRTLFNETLFGCVPEYPYDGNKAPEGLNRFPKPYGWSSHSSDWRIDIPSAIYMGAEVIERHFCLNDEDPEAGWSSNPQEFKAMTDKIREILKERPGKT